MNWFETLSVGDGVTVLEGYGIQTPRIAIVTRTTANFVFVGDSKFRRRDGYATGDSLIRCRICEPTQSHRDAWETHVLRNRIGAAAVSRSTTLETLRKMAAALEAK